MLCIILFTIVYISRFNPEHYSLYLDADPPDPFNISPDLKSKNRMCVYFHLVTTYAVLLVTMSTLYKCGLSDMSGTDVLC